MKISHRMLQLPTSSQHTGQSLDTRVMLCKNHIISFQIVQSLGQRHWFSVAIASRFCVGEGKMLTLYTVKICSVALQTGMRITASLPASPAEMPLNKRPGVSVTLNHVWLPDLSLLVRIDPSWTLHENKKKKIKKKNTILWRVDSHSFEWEGLCNIGIRDCLIKNYIQISLTLFRFDSPVLKLQQNTYNSNITNHKQSICCHKCGHSD